MWRARSDREGGTVVCIACGDDVSRSAAREYDKYGDRFDRRNKTFEYLCKSCHREQCHQPRGDLETLLVEIGAGERSQEDFSAWYWTIVEQRYGKLEEEP